MPNTVHHHPLGQIVPIDSGSPWLASPVFLAAASGFLLILYTHRLYKASFVDNTKITALGGLSVTNAWSFFNKRYDFLRSNFERGHKMFSFKILQHEIVALSGETGRQVFFHDKTLDFQEGYRLLMGGSPDVKDIKIDAGKDGVSAFNKRLAKILRRDRLQDIIPTLFSDVNKRMETWGSAGQLNPFNNIQTLVFQMTVRMASCSELSTNYSDLERMSKLYWQLERSATPVGLLLPWFPGKARRDKKEATRGLYDLIDHYIQLRRNATVPSSDAFDFLIAEGEKDQDIVAFVLGVIFAGVINTGMISCWTTIYLGAHPEWKAQAIAEIQKLINTHTNTTSTEPLHQRLAAIPISAWEDEMPVLECIVRETMRIVINGTFLRRNVVEDIEVSGKNIPRGAFMAYSSADAHLNPEYYPDPLKFDPSRFTGGSEQNSGPFLAWGTGRHPCTGMKVAKFEVKMILALMLTRYEYSLVDASGVPTTAVPKPDLNDIHQARPLGECFIRYQQVME
ncbi:cytochrome P450 [Athelia psychrophila]|uniref:Cytochrome P450 n=1 Tax=Athelia psychrophila TaxID=1759441 RepID=A0A166Q9I5_9AGAM|nr:cytochrome P450 [Fibularhizoctonia sp. CBS 109695]